MQQIQKLNPGVGLAILDSLFLIPAPIMPLLIIRTIVSDHVFFVSSPNRTQFDIGDPCISLLSTLSSQLF